MTKAAPARMSPLPQHREALGGPSERARDAFFASLSRELRCSFDEGGYFSFLEGAWQSVLGWQPEHLLGWHWTVIVHPGDHGRVAEAFARLEDGGEDERDMTLRLARPGGEHCPMTWTFVAGSGGESVLGLGLDRPAGPAVEPRDDADPSLLQRRNAELTARVAELEARYTAVERFAGTAAHQLAEPLVIAESSALLVSEELGEALEPFLRERLDAIGRGAARARQLIDTLLQDARSSHQPPRLVPVEVADVVDGVLDGMRTSVEERGARVVVGALPTVTGDPLMLRVVYENLLSNALKYGPRTSATVYVDATRLPSAWRLTVSSAGQPIPDSEAERVFEPFRRVRGEARASGSGLGLAICSRLVERMGGEIGVEPGSDGNAFFMVLPEA